MFKSRPGAWDSNKQFVSWIAGISVLHTIAPKMVENRSIYSPEFINVKPFNPRYILRSLPGTIVPTTGLYIVNNLVPTSHSGEAIKGLSIISLSVTLSQNILWYSKHPSLTAFRTFTVTNVFSAAFLSVFYGITRIL